MVRNEADGDSLAAAGTPRPSPLGAAGTAAARAARDEVGIDELQDRLRRDGAVLSL